MVVSGFVCRGEKLDALLQLPIRIVLAVLRKEEVLPVSFALKGRGKLGHVIG